MIYQRVLRSTVTWACGRGWDEGDRGVCLLAACRSDRAPGFALHGIPLRPPPRTRPRPVQAHRASARRLSRVAPGEPARRRLFEMERDPLAVRGRCREPRPVDSSAAATARLGNRSQALARGGDPVHGRVLRLDDPPQLLTRRLADGEADGHGDHQLRQPERVLPSARPLARRRVAQLLLLRPLPGRVSHPHPRACPRGSATTWQSRSSTR